jgi:hypothetical protein
MTKYIVVEAGVEREANAEEIAQIEKDWKNGEESAARKKQLEEQRIAAKAAAEAKLTALGLTADDLKALGLGGN